MHRVLVLRSSQGEQNLRATSLPPADDARRWLDQAFVDFDCEPVRASGKVLTVDKVVAIAQAAGADDLADGAWAAAFAGAALSALGREEAVIDLDDGVLK